MNEQKRVEVFDYLLYSKLPSPPLGNGRGEENMAEISDQSRLD